MTDDRNWTQEPGGRRTQESGGLENPGTWRTWEPRNPEDSRTQEPGGLSNPGTRRTLNPGIWRSWNPGARRYSEVHLHTITTYNDINPLLWQIGTQLISLPQCRCHCSLRRWREFRNLNIRCPMKWSSGDRKTHPVKCLLDVVINLLRMFLQERIDSAPVNHPTILICPILLRVWPSLPPRLYPQALLRKEYLCY